MPENRAPPLFMEFQRSAADIRYSHPGNPARTPSGDCLAQSVTRLLIARDDAILFSRQYGRTDRDRLCSRSIGKSIVRMLIQHRHSERAIRSVDDTAETYVPGIQEHRMRQDRSATSCMSSGVYFSEDRQQARPQPPVARPDGRMPGPIRQRMSTIGGIMQFNKRVPRPGQRRFSYKHQVDVLAIVLQRAVGKSASKGIAGKDLAARRREPTPHGWWMRRAMKSPTRFSTRSCAAMRNGSRRLLARQRSMGGQAGRSRHNGCSMRPPCALPPMPISLAPGKWAPRSGMAISSGCCLGPSASSRFSATMASASASIRHQAECMVQTSVDEEGRDLEPLSSLTQPVPEVTGQATWPFPPECC